MAPRTTASKLLSLAVIGAGVGAVDAAVGGAWDLFVLFVATGLLVLGAIAISRSSRPTVTLRRDLHRWLSDEAHLAGEPVGRLLDRAVAARRDGFDADLTGRSGRDS